MEIKRGLVRRSTGSWYEVEDPHGELHSCRLKGKFKIQGLKVTNPIAVGDFVSFALEETEEQNGIILNIEPRGNYIIRKSVHKTAHGHLLACNLDQAVLVVTTKTPRTSLGFIDRFLVTAEAFRIPVILLFNKMDLESTVEEKKQTTALMELYESLGYTSIQISALHGTNLNKLKELLQDKTTLISGHSGVGKSCLINELLPGLNLSTSEVSTFANKGVHTTTFAEMFKLPSGGYIIDTPGIKELGLVDMEKEEIAHYFPEMRDLIGACKFHNCLHLNEPKCAVKNAVIDGEIAESRYMSYLSMLEDDDNRR